MNDVVVEMDVFVIGFFVFWFLQMLWLENRIFFSDDKFIINGNINGDVSMNGEVNGDENGVFEDKIFFVVIQMLDFNLEVWKKVLYLKLEYF